MEGKASGQTGTGNYEAMVTFPVRVGRDERMRELKAEGRGVVGWR